MMELDVHICVKKEFKATLKDKDICQCFFESYST